MSTKPLVVILSMADWAGSNAQVAFAVHSLGEVTCRAITMHRSPFDYFADIIIPSGPADGNRKASRHSHYASVMRLLADADLIHVWNDEPDDRDFTRAEIDVPLGKVGVVTFTGTHYRRHHTEINRRLRKSYTSKAWRLTVQNPALVFRNECENVVFIPHAVNTNYLQPLPWDEREQWIGAYVPIVSRGRAVLQDVNHLKAFLQHAHPDWSVWGEQSRPWRERMEELCLCSLFFQDMDKDVVYWGRSTLEACALGMPVITYYSPEVLTMGTQGQLGPVSQIPIQQATDGKCLCSLVDRLIQDQQLREKTGQLCRDWVEKYFSYSVVGQQYLDIYKEALGL